jgi:hypothetical protein
MLKQKKITLESDSTQLNQTLAFALAQQVVEIEPLGEHRQRSVGVARPLFFRPVPIQFDAVLVGVAQIKRLADAVIAGAVERNAGLYYPNNASASAGRVG